MEKKLYVGNLAFVVDSNSLSSIFGQFGTVESAKVITDRDTGRSKGFGFVEMSSAAEAQACIREMNGRDHEGRQLNISVAKPQEPRQNRGFGGGGGGGFRSRY